MSFNIIMIFRSHFSKVNPSQSLQKFLASHPLVPWHQGAGLRLRDTVTGQKPQAVVLAVGPEGGWVDYEVQLFREHGFVQALSGAVFLWLEKLGVVSCWFEGRKNVNNDV